MAFNVPVQYYGLPDLPPYERQMVVRPSWGVVGAQVLLGKSTVREISFPVTITDHSTLQSLMNVIAQFDQELNDGSQDDLTADGITYPNCVFLGFIPDGPAFYDASGVHEYTQFGTVRFLQVGEVAADEEDDEPEP